MYGTTLRMVTPEKNWERALSLSEEEVKWGGGADVAHDDDGVNKDGCAVNAVNNC